MSGFFGSVLKNDCVIENGILAARDKLGRTTIIISKMVERIRKNPGLTTLKFQKLNDRVRAIGLPKDKLCTHCWDASSFF